MFLNTCLCAQTILEPLMSFMPQKFAKSWRQKLTIQVFDTLLQNVINLIININVTASCMPTPAEMEQIVSIRINVTIDLWPTAAEIEKIVTLIANLKRNI